MSGFKGFLLSLILTISVHPALSIPTPATEDELASSTGPKYTDVMIPVSITAKNADLSSLTDLLDVFELIHTGSTLVSLFDLVAGLVDLPFTALQRGTYGIASTYSEPEIYVHSRRDTIQLVAHPATYDRAYPVELTTFEWLGGSHPNFNGTLYSWIIYASKLGYSTFSFDRLGNGGSDHPNSITTVQCPAQAATVHELVMLTRAGASPFPRKFRDLIFVGESLGSIVGDFANVEYPNDFNSSILGGFSKFWANALPGFTATAVLLPAVLTESARYGYLNDLGYLIANSLPGVQYLLFYGPGQHFDTNYVALDYAARGTTTIGEAITGALGISVAEDYTGSVLVLNGNQDAVFCGYFDLLIEGPGNCEGAGTLARTQALYPRANYSWFLLDNAGHCGQHQCMAQFGFKYAHDWLAAQGF